MVGAKNKELLKFRVHAVDMKSDEKPMRETSLVPREETCPACGYHIAVTFLEGKKQPLATLAWPKSAERARTLPQLDIDFVRCVNCGHVYNTTFDYSNVPYDEKPNLMFNHGEMWVQYLQSARDKILSALTDNPVIVEVGYGDGEFISSLADAKPNGRFVGFDPHGLPPRNSIVEYRAELFRPEEHLAELEPDLIISRHVLEHLTNPLGFLQKLSFCAAVQGILPYLFIEVPCIDSAIKNNRTVDFYYEHSSQFTTKSFTSMLSQVTRDIFEIDYGYDGEVIFGLARFGAAEEILTSAREARDFYISSRDSLKTVGDDLAALSASGKRVAIWGGTGKSAAFMCRYGVDAERFPLVVDSDPEKAGSFVPGTGQEIKFRDCLHEENVDVVIVPPQWRCLDITREMASANIVVDQVLIEHNGCLVDFFHDDHPYKRSTDA